MKSKGRRQRGGNRQGTLEERLDRIEDVLQAMLHVAYKERMEKENQIGQQARVITTLDNELKRSKNIANALTSCNEALVRSTSEAQFLLQVCELVVKSGDYQLVWIGFASQDADRTIVPVAQYGFEDGYLEKLKLSWDETVIGGQGAAGRAVRNRCAETVNDIANDPSASYCREEALKRGYAALIALPVVLEEEATVGVLNIYSKDAFVFNSDEVKLLSRMAMDIAYGISSIRKSHRNRLVEKKNQLEYKSRIVISNLLETSLKPITLVRMLEACLELILSIPWVSILSKGSIFLFDAENTILKMATQRSLSTPLLKLCETVELGYCLCGRAAMERKIVFSSCLDERHEVRFEGIAEHGHYCIPIMADDQLLGVLNLYVVHNHENDKDQELFLSTVANTLAGIIQRKAAEEQIHLLANTDSLTGVANRRAFMERLDLEVAKAKREKLNFAVLYLDLDRFKQVNDQLGHKAGDQLLIQVVKRVKSVLRETDTLGRIGGDEFALVLPHSPFAGAQFVAEKIIHLLNQPFAITGQEVSIGISIGCSIYPDHGTVGDLLLQKADCALYAVKSRGKNSVLLYEESFAEMKS
ncbi:MAG: GGDEF domain-containing protein [Magnetococcales bacterium]|nr:GGDEF domain-containing protein [Magnetococcales bacterium]